MNLITVKVLNRLRSMPRWNEELFTGPQLIMLNGTRWVIGTDRYSVLALNSKYFDVVVAEQTKELEYCPAIAQINIKQLISDRVNSEDLLVDRSRLDRWIGPYYDRRNDVVEIKTGLIRGVTIHRGLLARLLTDLPGQQVTIGPGKTRNSEYIWMSTSYWRAALACFADTRTRPEVFEEMD